jgi:hypothetical protein
MIFSVMCKIPNANAFHYIESYDVTEPELYIPKFLLIKVADFCIKKSKGNLNFNESIILEYLIDAFKSIKFINEDLDFLDIYGHINEYLMNSTELELKNLYQKIINPNEDGYVLFEVLEEVD